MGKFPPLLEQRIVNSPIVSVVGILSEPFAVDTYGRAFGDSFSVIVSRVSVEFTFFVQFNTWIFFNRSRRRNCRRSRGAPSANSRDLEVVMNESFLFRSSVI